MKHYGALQWVDFARGLAADQSAMGKHLAGGCARCREMAEFSGKLARIAMTMRIQQAPKAVVRRALAICPACGSKGWGRALRIPVKLVYDSFLASASAGPRAGRRLGWQALYRAGDCAVDMKIEPDPKSSRTTLVGQVSYRALPARKMENIPVRLMAGKRIVAETFSNRFGEFHMEYSRQGPLELCIQLDGGSRRNVAPLRGIAGQAARPRAAGGAEPRARGGSGFH